MEGGMKGFLRKTWLNPVHLARTSLLAVLLEAREYASGILLDIGCGNKPYYDVFSPRIEEHIGIELPSTLSHSQVVDVYADALYLPFRSGSVDTVLCTQCIEHIPEPAACIKETSRVLRRGGYLILTTPQVWGLHEEPHDYYRYTKYGLKYLAENSGFEVEYIKPSCGTWAMAGERISDGLFQRHGMVAVPVCTALQLASYVLDKIWQLGEQDTLDNIIVAKRI